MSKKIIYNNIWEVEDYVFVVAAELLESTDVNISHFDVEEEDEEMLTRFCNDQVRNSTQYTTVKNSNVTRWNSISTMIKSFEKNIGEFR